MTFLISAYVFLQVIGVIGTWWLVGKPRTPITRGTAIGTTGITILFVTLVLWLGHLAAACSY